MVLPGLKTQESVESIRHDGYEGRNILVMGNAGYKEEKLEVYTLYNYEDAIKKLKPTTEGETKRGSNLLNVVHDIFNEGRVTDPNSTFGLNKVYAINIGPEPTIQELIDALNVSETLSDVGIEAYPGLSDISALNCIDGHLKNLEVYGDYRIALAIAKKDAPITDMVKMTSTNEDAYISSGRVVLHVNPDRIGVFAAKVACTPYYQDPAYKAYKTVTATDTKNYRRDELETILDAGLVVDWILPDPTSGNKVLEPVYVRATNYNVNDTPADAELHHRLNADHHSHVTDQIARRYIKQNNTETARQAIEHSCNSYLEDEVQQSKLNGYSYEIYPNHTDPYSLIVKMNLVPVKSVHTIEINRLIQG